LPDSPQIEYDTIHATLSSPLAAAAVSIRPAGRLLLATVTQFDGLYGQDAFAYFQYALSLREAIGAGELPPPFFWPLGYPALVALTSLLTGPQPGRAACQPADRGGRRSAGLPDCVGMSCVWR
jgi:hypothetical protein